MNQSPTPKLDGSHIAYLIAGAAIGMLDDQDIDRVIIGACLAIVVILARIALLSIGERNAKAEASTKIPAATVPASEEEAVPTKALA